MVETLNLAIGGKCVVQPWYDFLEEMDFDDGDEISIYYRYYEKIWDIVIRKRRIGTIMTTIKLASVVQNLGKKILLM